MVEYLQNLIQLMMLLANQIEVVTAGVWSDGIASLTTFFTSSTQTNTQRSYYVDVSQKILQQLDQQYNFH
jgi:hypothetical protein